jgi:hypothetical protein
MTIERTSGDWSPIGSAPRDGTPVILWLVEDEKPPVLPLPVGFWTVNLHAGVGSCRLLGNPHALTPTDKSADGSRFFASKKIVRVIPIILYGTGVGHSAERRNPAAAIQRATIAAAATRLVGCSECLCASSRNSAMSGPGIN